MTKKSWLETAVTLSTVGGALLAVGLAKEIISKNFAVPDAVFVVSVILGAVLPILGAIAFLLAYVSDQVQRAVAHVAYGDLEAKYLCVAAALSDLPSVHVLYARHFGSDVPDLTLMREWIEKCPWAFTLVNKIVEKDGVIARHELVGSFKLLPLTTKGVRAIELGQATGSTFRPEHIAGGRARPTAFYVGDVVATTRFSRGVVIAHLNAAVVNAIHGPVTVYARPLTPDGLRVMTKHGFVQVADGRSAPEIGRACKLEVTGRGQSIARRRDRPYRLVPTRPSASKSAA